MADGPSFLTAPPSVPPEPVEHRGVVLQQATAATPYRAPGEIATPKPQPVAPKPAKASRPALDDALVLEKRGEWDSVGDRAGEHLMMGHGQYDAWLHVVIAFVIELLLFATLPASLLVGIFKLGQLGWAISAITGGIGAIWVFSNRWRCIEAFASKWCSGVMNLSILYVPFVAFIYANVRAIGKLRRMFAARA